MKYIAVLAIVACLLAPVTVLAGNTSTYSNLDTDACEKMGEDEVGIFLKCTGFKSYPIYYKEGDLHQSLLFGPASQPYLDRSFESFGPFNYTGRTVEWRLEQSGKPFAVIQRWFISNPNPDTGESDKALEGQVLVISRVAQPGDGAGCVTAYVDALENLDANTLAREIADTITSSFRCGVDQPAFKGKRGDLASDPFRSMPEL